MLYPARRTIPTTNNTEANRIPLGTSRHIRMTYPWELNSTVATFGCRSSFLDVKVSKFSAWSLDNADLVRSGVVSEIILVEFRV